MTPEQEKHMAYYHKLQYKIRELKDRQARDESEGKSSSWMNDSISELESQANLNFELATDRGY